MDVPFPRAASKRLISFFTFQISMFFSASFAWASLILAVDDASSCRYLEVFFAIEARLCRTQGQDQSFLCVDV